MCVCVCVCVRVDVCMRLQKGSRTSVLASALSNSAMASLLASYHTATGVCKTEEHTRTHTQYTHIDAHSH